MMTICPLKKIYSARVVFTITNTYKQCSDYLVPVSTIRFLRYACFENSHLLE